MELTKTDILIIGSGIAGTTAALELAKKGRKVILITKSSKPEESNTFYAQGGIIYKGEEDSPDLLAKDITVAGAYLSNPRAVEILSNEGPILVKNLLIEDAKVDFDLDGKSPALTIEGGHGMPRIIHQADATGKSIETALIKKIYKQKNIKFIKNLTSIDLITSSHGYLDKLAVYDPVTCLGAYFLDSETGKVIRILAKQTILATGGLGQNYLYTTNPAGARGDGVAMAFRAGARVINMEYVQFHPTAFYHKDAPRFLLTEAIRGEGARLTDENGKPFMDKYSHDWKDLAPRDIVARAIYSEMLKGGKTNVYLDLKSYISKEKILKHFPNLYEACLKYGIDITSDLVPVVPAAHYHCGGIWVDEKGLTTIKNLYAVGETSCTGLHGANRLASTSLLEGLVWGYRAAKYILSQKNVKAPNSNLVPKWVDQGKVEPDPALINQDMNLIRQIMWNCVGLVRSSEGLIRAKADLSYLKHRIEKFYQESKLSDSLIGLRNVILVSQLIAESAWENKQSAGCHYRIN